MDRLIYVEDDYDSQYGRFWANLGDVVRDRDLFMSRPQDFDLVCFTGGEDVSPELYGHENLSSGNSPRRDAKEQVTYDLAAEYKIPMTGICRGSQFLNVQAGGTMIQDLHSHGGGRHTMLIEGGDRFEVTSSHHQMSILGENGTLLGWAEEFGQIERCSYDGDLRDACRKASLLVDDEQFLITEAFAYPDLNIFAVQHHPEWQKIDEETPQWTLRMIREYCFNEAAETTS